MKHSIRIIILSIIIMSFSFNNDNKLLYKQALTSHISNLKADTVFVLKCFDIELPKHIGSCIVIDITENANSFLSNSPSLYAIKLMPIEINKGNVEITLID